MQILASNPLSAKNHYPNYVMAACIRTVVSASNVVAWRVGVDTVGILWSLVVLCDKVTDPSALCHIMT